MNRIIHGANTPEENAEHDRQLFRETFAKHSGEALPLSPQSMVEKRQRALFEAAMANGW